MKKAFVYSVTLLSLFSYFLIILFNYKIDALGIHSTQEFYLNDAGYSRYQNIGIAKNQSYETILTGTSLSEIFRTTLVDKLFNTQSIKIPMSGGSAKEQSILISNAISDNTEKIIWDVHYTAYSGSSDKMHKSMQFPLFLYDDNKLNDLKFYASLDLLKISIKKILFRGKYFTNNYDELYNQFEVKKSLFTKEKVVKYIYSLSLKFLDVAYNDDYSYKNLKSNFDKNILPIIIANPKISFEFYFPPYTPYYFLGIYKSGFLEDNLKFKEYFIANSFIYPNMNVHDFSIDYQITNNLNNFKDTHHFSQSVSDSILEKIKGNEYLISNSQNREKEMDSYRKYIINGLESINDLFQ